jgi:hypothetical protein
MVKRKTRKKPKRRRRRTRVDAWSSESPAEAESPAAAESPPEPPPEREPLPEFRGYINSDVMRTYGSKQVTQRSSITCFRCGEQGHYKIECLSWRTKMCIHFARATGCRDGDNCSYAHDPSELRCPWESRCVRVVKRGGRIWTLGCQSDQHTFKSCPSMRCVVCDSRSHWACDDECPFPN